MTKQHITPQNGVNTVKEKKKWSLRKQNLVHNSTLLTSHIFGDNTKKKKRRPNNFTEPSKTGISGRNEGYAQ